MPYCRGVLESRKLVRGLLLCMLALAQTSEAGTIRHHRSDTNDGSSVVGYNDKVLFEDFDSGAAGDNWSGAQTQLDLEYLIASGDSGGPMFMNFGSGAVVAGVHSFIASADGNTDADYGDIAGSTRVSSYASWIASTMSDNDPVAPELSSWIV